MGRDVTFFFIVRELDDMLGFRERMQDWVVTNCRAIIGILRTSKPFMGQGPSPRWVIRKYVLKGWTLQWRRMDRRGCMWDQMIPFDHGNGHPVLKSCERLYMEAIYASSLIHDDTNVFSLDWMKWCTIKRFHWTKKSWSDQCLPVEKLVYK